MYKNLPMSRVLKPLVAPELTLPKLVVRRLGVLDKWLRVF